MKEEEEEKDLVWVREGNGRGGGRRRGFEVKWGGGRISSAWSVMKKRAKKDDI